jgi:hypothetical protein
MRPAGCTRAAMLQLGCIEIMARGLVQSQTVTCFTRSYVLMFVTSS